MKLFAFSLTSAISLLSLHCSVPNESEGRRIGIPFKDIEFRLLQGKIDDSSFQFSSSAQEFFLIKFNDRRFRGFEGGFRIKGTSSDSGSVYRTSTPYAGFYHVERDSSINLQWFSNTSWTMDFNKHQMGKRIAKLFRFAGRYYYNDTSLIFYTVNEGKRDTIIVMKTY